MKILLIGFLAFSAWSSFSTYIYVCKIKGLCKELTTTTIQANNNNASFADDATLNESKVDNQKTIPANKVIYFAFDKSDFNSNASTDKYFTESKAYLDQNSQARLSITGHTDSVGSNKYNVGLGFRRAQSLQQYFEGKGIDSNKITIESMGESAPADINSTTAGRANNRRTELTIKN
jgi:outer membrane protein OmpA-like peptidoglycan-associated protein